MSTSPANPEFDQTITLSFRDLRVVVVRDGTQWFAQGVDVDYAASGVSIEDVKQRFALGLVKSLLLNLEETGSVDRFLKYPPRDEIERLEAGPDSKKLRLSVSSEPFPANIPLPYDRIAFYEPQAA